jgi:glycosyltransferase involved in cell wall biosynthesis
VPYGDANELAGAIDSILDLPDLWRRRARAAADRARVRFGTDVVCEELEAVYLEAIGARGEEGRRSA